MGQWVRRTLSVCLFFIFVAEGAETVYAKFWVSPMGWANGLLILPWPDRIRGFDHVLVACLLLGLGAAWAKGPKVIPMRNALLLSGATIVAWFAFGVLRGGDARAASWQVYQLMSGVLLTFALAAAFRTPEHFRSLGKLLLAAAAYRALMCWLFQFLFVRPNAIPLQELVTDHDDTVLWVVALLILAAHILESRSLRKIIPSIAFALFLLGAIEFNRRRLAWVSLALGALFFVLLLPRGFARRRVVKGLALAVPVILLYVAVGWGRPETIFKPLRSFATVTTEEDASTKARNVENLGLIATAQTNWMVGTGWGHPYIALSDKYSIASGFELWPYIPHNSLLGTLAYTGALGFCGYWLAFPAAMFLNSRMARLAKAPLARRVGLVGAAQMVVCANQCFGDMGTFSFKTVYLLSASCAIALRLPIVTEVWPGRPKVDDRPTEPRPQAGA